MGFDRDTSVGYVANHLARLLEKNLAQAIRPLGLMPGQFPVLLALWVRDGQSQKALVSITDVEQATMANTLARMERDGLIVRRSVAGDARARTIHVTPKARALEGPATEAAIVSALAPGNDALIDTVGKSTFGKAATGSRRNPKMPKAMIDAVISVVITGRRMQSSERFKAQLPVLAPPAPSFGAPPRGTTREPSVSAS